MSKVFVIGAGLSKALAGAPLATELFEMIYQKAQIRDDDDRPQRELDRKDFNAVVNYLQQEAKPLLDYLQRDGTKVKTCKGINTVSLIYCKSLIINTFKLAYTLSIIHLPCLKQLWPKC